MGITAKDIAAARKKNNEKSINTINGHSVTAADIAKSRKIEKDRAEWETKQQEAKKAAVKQDASKYLLNPQTLASGGSTYLASKQKELDKAKQARKDALQLAKQKSQQQATRQAVGNDISKILPEKPAGVTMGLYNSVVKNKLNEAKNQTKTQRKYADVASKPYFKELSESAGGKPGFWYKNLKDSSLDFGQFKNNDVNTVDAIRNTKDYQNYAKNPAVYSAKHMAGGGTDQNIMSQYEAVNNMSDKDYRTYNYLYNTKGKKAADEYFNGLVSDVNTKKTETGIQLASDMAKNYPAFSSAISPLMAPATSAGLLGAADAKLRGRGIDANASYFLPSTVQDTIRGTVSQDLGNVGGFLYQTGMSMADSLLSGTMLGPTAGAAFLGGQSASSTIRDVKAKGGSDSQALLVGTLAGVYEGLFERVSLGNFKSLQEVPINSVKDIAMNTLKSIGVNASEEAATEIANVVTDSLLMGGLSDYSIEYKNLLANGASEKDAKVRIASDIAERVGLAGLGGALMGGAMSGIGQTINYATNGKASQSTEQPSQNNTLPKPEGNINENLPNSQTSVQAVESENNTQTDETVLKIENTEPVNTKDVSAEWGNVENATVTGVSSVEDGNVNVNIKSGGENVTDSISNVKIDNPEVSKLYNAASEYETNGAKAFVSSYDGNINLDTYKKGFDAYYDSGLVNVPEEKIPNAFAALLPEEIRAKAYTAGMNDAQAKVQRLEQTKMNIKAQRKGGIIINEISNKMDVNTRDALNALGKAARVTIQVKETLAGGQANGMYKDGTLYIALDSQNPYMAVAKHELTHAIQDSSPEMYKAYKDFVISEINKSDSKTYNEMVDRLMERYSEIGENLTRDAAQDEIVADAAEMFLTNEDAINRLTQQDSNLAHKVVKAIHSIIENIGRAMKEFGAKSKAAIALNQNMEAAQKAEELWIKALNEGVSERTKIVAEARYSVKVGEKYAENVNWEGTATREIQIDDIPDYEVGQIINPGLSWTDGGMFRVETSKKYAVVFEITEPVNGHKVDYANRTETYDLGCEGCENEKEVLINSNFEITEFYPWDEEIEFARVLVKPVERATSNGQQVNTQNLSGKFSLKDSEGNILTHEQQEYFKDSNVRDENGNLLAVYHGTNATFTVFNPKLSKDIGVHFGTLEQAKKFSRNKIPDAYYLNAKVNKYVIDDIFRNPDLEITDILYKLADGDLIDHKQVHEIEDSLSYPYKKAFEDYHTAMYEDEDGRVSKEIQADYNNATISLWKTVKKYIVKNGYTGIVYKNSFEGKGNSYVVFNPNQAKLVTNLNPTSNSDIRYQLKDVDEVEYNRVVKENEKLSEMNTLLNEQFKLTKEFKPKEEELRRVAKSILKEYSSDYSLDTMTDNLKSLWSYIQNSDNVDGGEVAAATAGMAKKILEQSKTVNNYMIEQYADLKSKLKNTAVNLSDQDKADLGSAGGYNAFRKSNFGKLRLSSNGMSVDSFYQELNQQYPELFPEQYTHPADQLIVMSEVADSFRPIYENPFGMNMDEAASELAYEIYDKYFEIPRTSATFADKQKTQLEKTKALYRKKIFETKQDYKQKYLDRLKEVKLKDKNLMLERLKAQQQRIEERIREQKVRKSAQADVNKWRSGVRHIAKNLSGMLLNPNDKKHIPGNLRSSIIQICQALDLDTGKTGPGGTTTNISEKLSDLHRAYDKLASEDTGSGIEGFYDDDMAVDLADLVERTKGKRINQLGYEDIHKVYDIMKHIRYIVNQENKMFSTNIRETVTESSKKQLNQLSAEKRYTQRGITANSRTLSLFRDMLTKGNIKPYYFFKQVGGEMQQLYTNVRNGEDKFVRNFENGKNYAREVIDRYNYQSWSGKNDKAEIFTTSQGRDISLTTGEKLYLYMAYKREQGKNHIQEGGVIVNELQSKSKSGSTKGLSKVTDQSAPAKLDEYDMIKIADSLTDEQKGFADEMGKYLSNELAALGNEVSNKMYGYDKFTEKNYIPITSDPNFLNSKVGITDDRRIKRAGFTKALTPKASNPIIVADFMDIWSKHLIDMSMYNALVLPLEDFQRVYNFRESDPDTGQRTSVKSALKDVYGPKVNDYIKNLLNDINGGIKAPSGGEISNILLSKMKVDAVMGNLSVAIQQPSSIARAQVIIDPKYFVKTAFSNRSYKELMKYSPQAVLKQYGYFDVNMGWNLSDVITRPEYEGPIEKFKAFFTDKNVRNDVFSWLPQKMDEITWAHIWNAIKAETLDKTSLKEGSEEFYNHVSERFKEVIDRSQVMDSVFQRSEIMRSQNFAAKLATNFMAEPTVNYNMIFDAVNEYKKGGKDAKVYFTRSVASVVSAMVLNSLLKSLITAMRDKDKDKEYVEKYLDSFVKNISDDPVSMIPYLNTVASIFKGYEAVRPDMQIIQNFYYAWNKLDKDKYTPAQKALQMAEAIAPFFNVPLKNIARDIESIYRTGAGALADVGLIESQSDYDKLRIKYDINDLNNSAASSAYYDLLYQAQQDGDKELFNQIYRDLINSGRKPSSIDSALAKHQTGKLFNRKAGEEYTDPLVIAAADAYDKQDEKAYADARQKLVDQGYTIQEVDSAIRSLRTERAKENAPTAEEFIAAYKTGDESKWKPLFEKMRAAGWSQKDIVALIKE